MEEKCHFIGIGGIGMSGLARIMLDSNTLVSGSDVTSNALIEDLMCKGAKVNIGHDAKYVAPGDTVVYSSGISADNPEYQAALQANCKMLHRADLLLALTQGHKLLGVTGTHGKTTTTALLAHVLSVAGLDPSYAVGGIIPTTKTNAYKGKGDNFVAELDESDGSFLKFKPYGGIVTNIGADHMDYYKTKEKLVTDFASYCSQIESFDHFFWCGDNMYLKEIAPKGISYGFCESCQLRALNYEQKGWSLCYDILYQGATYSNVQLPLVGAHNALNSLAVFGLALSFGVDVDVIRQAFATFPGVARRCEKKGEEMGVLVIDDYAHHPTEICAVLHAVRQAVEERRVIVVFQPHRYSRTRDSLGEYGGVFDEADEVIVTEIYAAGEAPIPGVSHEDIIEENEHLTETPMRHISKDMVLQHLMKELRPHDVVITIGAGDVTAIGAALVESIKKKRIAKLKVGIVVGGRSSEHEVSLKSGTTVAANLREDIHDARFISVCRKGNWSLHEQYPAASCIESLSEGVGCLRDVLNSLEECDVLFPVLHGPFGEDGTIQGLFEMISKPYVGCDHRASAVCMDKVMSKQICAMNNVPIAPYQYYYHYQWKESPSAIIKEVEEALTFPIFVKGAHSGSSVAVFKVERGGDCFVKAMDSAFEYDDKVIVEQGIKGRELEFAVYGNDRPVTFPPGEVLTHGNFYDYQAKYGDNGFLAVPKAEIGENLQQEGMRLAIDCYRALGCHGMARIDFFLDGDQRYWFNEINPIPGLTTISVYPKVCEENGIPMSVVLDKLISLALQRHRKKCRLKIVPDLT